MHYPPQADASLRPSWLDLVHALMVLAVLLHGGFVLAAPANIQLTSTRVWPAQDYTRVTLESREPIQHKLLSLKDPERLVWISKTWRSPHRCPRSPTKSARMIPTSRQ
jgi:hypothetical protein